MRHDQMMNEHYQGRRGGMGRDLRDDWQDEDRGMRSQGRSQDYDDLRRGRDYNEGQGYRSMGDRNLGRDDDYRRGSRDDYQQGYRGEAGRYGQGDYGQGDYGQSGYGQSGYGQSGRMSQRDFGRQGGYGGMSDYNEDRRGFSDYGYQGGRSMGQRDEDRFGSRGGYGWGSRDDFRYQQQGGYGGQGQQQYGDSGYGRGDYGMSRDSGYGREGGYGRSFGDGGRYNQDYGRSLREDEGMDRGRFGARTQSGFAGGTRWPGQESGMGRGRRFGKGPRGYQRSDERIQEEINERLASNQDVDVSDIEVKVNNCEVTLSGKVEDRWSKHFVENLAADVFGVKDVENKLRIQSDDQSLSGRGDKGDKGDKDDKSTSTSQRSQTGTGNISRASS